MNPGTPGSGIMLNRDFFFLACVRGKIMWPIAVPTHPLCRAVHPVFPAMTFWSIVQNEISRMVPIYCPDAMGSTQLRSSLTISHASKMASKIIVAPTRSLAKLCPLLGLSYSSHSFCPLSQVSFFICLLAPFSSLVILKNIIPLNSPVTS